jgi:hypothetical protein
VALGAAAAPDLHLDRLALALGAFFLAVGIAAHALDELSGRPLRTRIPDGVLIGAAAVSLVGAVALGGVGVSIVGPTLVPFILAGTFMVLAYNLELFHGRFHSDAWFAASWGAFPAFTGFWVNSGALEPAGVIVAAGCFTLTVVQRRLSTPVRELRRRTVAVEGEQRLADGRVVRLSAAGLAEPLDRALVALSVAIPLIATSLVVART